MGRRGNESRVKSPLAFVAEADAAWTRGERPTLLPELRNPSQNKGAASALEFMESIVRALLARRGDQTRSGRICVI